MRATTDHETWVDRMNTTAGHPVDDEGQRVLGAVEPLQVVVDEDGQQADEDDPLGGAEVAAVDAGQEHADQQRGPAVDVRARPVRPASVLTRGWTAISTAARRTSAGMAALNTLEGRASSRTAPVRPPASEAAPSVSSRDRWPTSSRR